VFTSPSIELFYIFFQGILLFQALVFFAIYFIAAQKDILFYSLFLSTAAAYFFINAPYIFFGISEEEVWSSTWYDFINTPVIIVINLFYLLFLKEFFSDITNNAAVSSMFNFLLWLMPVIFVVFLLLTFLKYDRQFIYYIVKIITIFPSIIAVFIIIRLKLPFSRLVATGLSFTVIGTSLTTWMDFLYTEGTGDSIFSTTYPFFFIRLGTLGDMIFYLAAILKKWHYQEKQLAIEKLQSLLTIEKLRNKISSELHDDIGGTLSGIAKYSHMTDGQLQKGDYIKAKNSINVIQRSANEMIDKLGDLVWAVNPDKDSFTTMLERIKEYGEEMRHAKNIQFRCFFENTSIKKETGMDVRQHLYLFAKEAINNAVKHSGGTAIDFDVTFEKGSLVMLIRDNGSGLDTEQSSKGNGLANMQKRAAALDAVYDLSSGSGAGTQVKMVVKTTQ